MIELYFFRISNEQQQQKIAQLENERSAMNNKIIHLEDELTDHRKVFFLLWYINASKY